MKTNIQSKTIAFIQKYQLFSSSDKILVGLSGGADSVALITILVSLGYQCEAAHCNFHLRDEESDRDEDFVKDLCKKNKINLHIEHFQTKEYAKAKHISIEMAARELRYNWFEKLRKATGCSVIAIAHHKDDSIETFLLNLIRGTGIDGLCGIRPKNNYIVRPLLALSQDEVLDYLSSLKQDFVNDSSNAELIYQRNKIRHQVIPLLETLNPSVRDTIISTTERMQDVAHYYHEGLENNKEQIFAQEKKSKTINIGELLKTPAPKSLLYYLLKEYNFSSDSIPAIYNSISQDTGGRFYSKTHRVTRDRDVFRIETLEQVSTKQKPTIKQSFRFYENDYKIPKETKFAVLDAEKLTLPLTLRLWKAGDWFIPFGMKGRKLISDYLTDKKVSSIQRENTYVMCSGNDIVWIVGERSDNRYRITDKTTQILQLEVL
jgi:tRNA(Ile)-lysidine synthase